MFYFGISLKYIPAHSLGRLFTLMTIELCYTLFSLKLKSPQALLGTFVTLCKLEVLQVEDTQLLLHLI
jgi:hypothetical protein